ncbi:STAS domain-containing protein [Kitasatospora sp. McL0602]|uniref:STAS domain-containing protein n=1 Tax=Kitasatospora sp. McL0602 TaxID=3439530 RepID=UPI003F8BEE32
MDTEAQLTVTTRLFGQLAVVRPEGELDHDSVGPLREAVDAVLAGPAPQLVVDCSGLGFCDSTGLNLLLRAREAAELADGRTVLVEPSPIVTRMLEITGAAGVFQIFPTVEAAVAAVDAGVDAAAE